MFNKSRLISKFPAVSWRESETGSEKHISEGAHRSALASGDSEKPFKGYAEKIVLCNYRDLCLPQFQEVHCYPGALRAEESTEEKCNVVFGWRPYDHTHKVNKVTSFSVWLGGNKATPPLELHHANPPGADKATRAGTRRHILVSLHRADRSSSLLKTLLLPRLLVNSAHLGG